MANVRLVVLAVCFMVAEHRYSVLARPQFFLPGGFSLGVPSFNFGQPPAHQFQQPQQQFQQPQQQYQQPQFQQQQPQQQYQQPQQQYQQPQQQQYQPQPNVGNSAPNGSAGLGSRFGGSPETPVDQTDPSALDENPCENIDTGLANEPGNENVTDQPCLGIGDGNRINPKQAALLSLVG